MRFTPLVFLDPEYDTHAFGINRLQCAGITNTALRNDTYTRAKGIFDKLWKNTFEEKPWLQLILQNTIHAFLENQEYAIAECPLFYRDSDFRHHIVRISDITTR